MLLVGSTTYPLPGNVPDSSAGTRTPFACLLNLPRVSPVMATPSSRTGAVFTVYVPLAGYT